MKKHLEHHFSVDDAIKFKSIPKAVIVHNLRYWLLKNEANDDNINDGFVWTYNSMKAYAKLFPYLTEKVLYNTFKQLEDAGIIKTANYNKSPYDRTKWYTLPDEFKIEENAISQTDKSISPNGKMENPKRENEIPNLGETIPDIKTNSKPTKKPEGKKEKPANLLIFESLFKKKFNSEFSHDGKIKENEQIEALEKLFEIKKDKLREFLEACFWIQDIFLLSKISPIYILSNLNEFNAKVSQTAPIVPDFKEYSRAEMENIEKVDRNSIADYQAATYQGRYFFARKIDVIKYKLVVCSPKLVA